MTNISENLKKIFGVIAYGTGVALDSVGAAFGSGGKGILGVGADLSKGIGTEFLADVGESEFDSLGEWLEAHRFNRKFAEKLKVLLKTPDLREVVKDIVNVNSKKRLTDEKSSGRPDKAQNIKARDVATLSRVWLCQYDKEYIKKACERSEQFNKLDDEKKERVLEILETACSIYLEDAYDNLDKDSKVLASVIIRSLGSRVADLADSMHTFVERHQIDARGVRLEQATVKEVLYEAYTLKCPFCGNVSAATLSDSGNHKYKCGNCDTIFFCGPESSYDQEKLEEFIDTQFKKLSESVKDEGEKTREHIAQEGEKNRKHDSQEHEKTRAEIAKPAQNAKELLRKALSKEYIDKQLVRAYAETVIKSYPDDMTANFTLKFLSQAKRAVTEFIDNILINDENISDENISDVDMIIDVLLRYAEKRFLVALNSLVEHAYKKRNPDKFSDYNTKIFKISKTIDDNIYNLKYRRDVFIAYSSKDIACVDELVHYLEEHDLRTKFDCFVAHRNLPHCFVDDYEKDLRKAMIYCSAFIFVSTKNSRDSDCDAIAELQYFVDNKPTATRIEYLAEDYDKPLCGTDKYVKQLFDGREYCVKGSYDALVQRLLRVKFSSTNNVSSERAVPPAKEPVSKPTAAPAKVEISKSAAPSRQPASPVSKATPSQSPAGYRDEDFIRDAQIENGVLIQYKSKAKEVVIPSSVTSIGERAFYGCSSLTSITIPDSVTSIGDKAFFDCSSLTSITIPDSVTSIGSGAFGGCSSLTAMTVDRNNKVYRSENNCVIERKTNTLVAGCKNSVIPSSVTSIGFSAFGGCNSLTSISIPDSVTSIDTWAFYGCSSLASITIPDSVTSISSGAFGGCSSLTSITVDSNNKVYRSENNCVIERETNTLVAGCKNSVIPSSVTSIGRWAFNKCSSLTSISIPASVTSIGKWAFYGCNSLTSITIPASVTSIGSWAFSGCSSLTSMTVDSNNKVYFSENNCFIERETNTLVAGCKNSVIPSSVTSIGERAFSGCNSLTSITIPDSVTSIGFSAFGGCSALTSISIPASVTSIGEGAFAHCSSLKTVYYQGSEAQWKKIQIYDTTIKECKIIFFTPSQTSNSKSYQDEDFIRDAQIENGVLKKYKGNAKEVVIPSSVTSIGDSAFDGCSSLTFTTIPSSVTSIGKWAFSGCFSLTSITIPDSVTSIGDSAFDGCSSLTFTTIPSSVTSIGKWAFSGCFSLTSITIPDSVTSIGDSAFDGCASLSSMTVDRNNKVYRSENNCIIERETNTLVAGCKNSVIPSSVTSIGDSAFDGCSSLTSITIPASVTSIGDSAFAHCSSLTSITIPDSVTSIGKWAFDGCYSLKTVYYQGSEAQWKKIQIYDKTIKECKIIFFTLSQTSNSKSYQDENFIRDAQIENGVLIKYKGNAKEVVIPSSVTSIGKEAFSMCSSLTSISIPDSVTSIGYSAFSYCSALTSITVDNNNKVYRSENNCIIERKTNTLVTGCKNSVIPSSVTSIGEWAFSDCNSLTSISIPASVTSIGYSAFNGCSSLASITIPDSVTSIGDSAFAHCSSLTSISIPASFTSIGDRAFFGCKSLVSIVIPDSVTSIGTWAFYGCKSLTSITIPDSVTSIGNSAFGGCSSLASITIPDSVTSIGDSAFNGCKSLTSLTIPVSVTSIGEWAFNGCSSLTSITIPSSVTSIGTWAFYGCSSLTSITVDNNNKVYRSENNCIIERKTNTLVAGCKNSVIPSSVTSIGDSAFSGCNSLTSISIPDSVTSIGSGAFGGCSSLASITVDSNNKVYRSENNCIIERKTNILIVGCKNSVIPSSVTSIGKSAFYGCKSLISITIPNSVTSIGEWAFAHCSSLTSITIPASVTSIGEYAFFDCKFLISIIIPSSVTSIGKWAFDGCKSLASITIPDSVTSIGEWAFDGCYSLKTVYYQGSEAQWEEIEIDDSTIKECKIIFNAR